MVADEGREHTMGSVKHYEAKYLTNILGEERIYKTARNELSTTVLDV